MKQSGSRPHTLLAVPIVTPNLDTSLFVKLGKQQKGNLIRESRRRYQPSKSSMQIDINNEPML